MDEKLAYMAHVDFDERQWLAERRTLYRRFVWGLFGFIAVLALFSTYWMMGTDTYHESLAEHPAGASGTWPDGSSLEEADVPQSQQ